MMQRVRILMSALNWACTGGAQSSQSDAARGPTTPPRPVIGHRQGPPSRRARGWRHGWQWHES